MTYIKPKKSLGQNFLTDQYYISKILESFQLESSDTVLEIGPGKGILTFPIMNKVKKFYAVEIDNRIVDYLNNEFENNEKLKENRDRCNFELIHQDFMKFDFENEILDNEIKIVGNLPYHVTSGIIFKVMDLVHNFETNKKKIHSLTIMIQKEVADRIVAKPGSKEYGIIAILTSFFADRKIMFDVPPEAFTPPPKVNSSIIKFTFREKNPNFKKIKDYAFFKKIVKTVFNQRRKMLRKTLKPFVGDIETIKSVELTLRPEDLTLDNFIDLTNEIMKINYKL